MRHNYQPGGCLYCGYYCEGCNECKCPPVEPTCPNDWEKRRAEKRVSEVRGDQRPVQEPGVH
jgi:hypothetical protein